ncbi:MAG: glycosyl transferase [Candidatus Kerfeldbacteria bacterium CG_4_10_14_0_8_um_filter_42_10]|uniref:Glycosyl transferase n=1 Tax=Candidatus Kerfeldbacteria bacterium CG_4_10_14_0_8_um_filter_42_10 TaxID=2014248 RepID=A0A2M7RJD2_9BACT|nr:MAG: glycosyl transferase [Candidatus Kerfeldbacteria bacterium CG_4_10_14_0_8_um_filter_42_10]
MKLSIIMPVYNERATIEEIIRRVNAAPYEKEIILVDDGSSDGTKEILEEIKDPLVRIYYHDKNYGKGRAVRTGLAKASGGIILIQDADLEYDPREYAQLLRPILEGKAEVVYGSRFRGEGKTMFFWHAVGNNFLTFMTNLLYNTTLTDMETCYKVMKKEVLKGITLKSDKFNIEPELTAKILKKGYRIYEVPISYAGREYSEGKKITWKDGIVALWTLIKHRLVN